MNQIEILAEIPGAQNVVDWFGMWPSFHDAEVLSISLNRRGLSRLKTHTWLMTSDVDENGYYKLEKDAVVTFLFEEVSDSNLAGFNFQNVVFGMSLNKTVEAFELVLSGCFGVEGSIFAKKMVVEIEPGMPAEGM